MFVTSLSNSLCTSNCLPTVLQFGVCVALRSKVYCDYDCLQYNKLVVTKLVREICKTDGAKIWGEAVLEANAG